jgi:signal peptidase I
MLSFLVFVGWIVLFVRFFIANPYTVVGASMAPTFEESDFIIVDKITPRFGELQEEILLFLCHQAKQFLISKELLVSMRNY